MPAQNRTPAPQEFLRRNSYCARGHPFPPRQPPPGDLSSPRRRVFLPRPPGEGRGEGLPRTMPGLSTIAPAHPQNPPKKRPESPQEFLRRNSSRARSPRFHPPIGSPAHGPLHPPAASPRTASPAPVRLFLPRPLGEGRGEGLPRNPPGLSTIAPAHPPNQPKKRPETPQEFLRRNSSRARDLPFPPRQLPPGDASSPRLRVFLPLPPGEGWGEGLPRTPPRLGTVAPAHPQDQPRRRPELPQEFLRRNSSRARSLRFQPAVRPGGLHASAATLAALPAEDHGVVANLPGLRLDEFQV